MTVTAKMNISKNLVAAPATWPWSPAVLKGSMRSTTLAFLVLVPLLAALAGGSGAVQSPTDPEPADVTLGRLLFWDPILSGDRDIACATCHHPDLAYADGRELSLGTGSVGLGPARVDRSGGEIPVVRRNSPTILNTAFNGVERRRRRRGGRSVFDGTVASVDQERAPMLWDSRVRSLESQALEPLKALEEMRGRAYDEDAALDAVVERLQAIPEYVTRFREAFGEDSVIDASQIGRAVAGFERTLVAMDSPFDRYQAGDASALTPQQIRGLEEPDAGAGRFRFRTPSLRNVALTAPYMHNGTVATLEDVLEFYDEGRSRNPNVVARRSGDAEGVTRLSRSFRRVDDMSPQEQADIIAFLEALTDPNFDRTIPARVPSDLPPGGFIDAR